MTTQRTLLMGCLLAFTLSVGITTAAQAASLKIQADNYAPPAQAAPVRAMATPISPDNAYVAANIETLDEGAITETDGISESTPFHPIEEEPAKPSSASIETQPVIMRSQQPQPQLRAQPTPAQIQAQVHQQRTLKLTQFINNYNKRLNEEQAHSIAEAIMEFSNKYHVDFRVVTGVIAVESSFRSDAVSSSGAIGLGQLKPSTAKWLGVVNPFDPIDNVAGATRYLGYLLNKYNGNIDRALSAYYQGPGTVDRQGITPACKYYLMKINNVLKPLVIRFE